MSLVCQYCEGCSCLTVFVVCIFNACLLRASNSEVETSLVSLVGVHWGVMQHAPS